MFIKLGSFKLCGFQIHSGWEILALTSTHPKAAKIRLYYGRALLTHHPSYVAGLDSPSPICVAAKPASLSAWRRIIMGIICCLRSFPDPFLVFQPGSCSYALSLTSHPLQGKARSRTQPQFSMQALLYFVFIWKGQWQPRIWQGSLDFWSEQCHGLDHLPSLPHMHTPCQSCWGIYGQRQPTAARLGTAAGLGTWQKVMH